MDAEAIDAVSDFCYANAPYFLSQSELNRIDSLLSQPGYAAQQMNHNRQMLMLPTAGYAAQSIQCDPLDLFGPTLSQMRSATSDMKCETFDGHIFSPDKTHIHHLFLAAGFGMHAALGCILGLQVAFVAFNFLLLYCFSVPSTLILLLDILLFGGIVRALLVKGRRRDLQQG